MVPLEKSSQICRFCKKPPAEKIHDQLGPLYKTFEEDKQGKPVNQILAH
jgi:hypothetical protein